MITIRQEGKQVKLIVDPKMSNGNVMHFYWDCGSEWYAELMVEKLCGELCKTVQQVRAEEYYRGWKHAKAKKHGPDQSFVGLLKKFWNS